VTLISAVWAQNTPGGTEREVAALEHKWVQALQTNNPDLLAPLLAEKFVNTSSDGEVTGKAAALAEVKGDKWSSVENTDMKVSVFGLNPAHPDFRAFSFSPRDPIRLIDASRGRETDSPARRPKGSL
jgi:hypothetical protein